MKESITLITSKNTLDIIKDKYQINQKENKNPYILFSLRHNDIVINAYSNKKNEKFKITFIGENASKEARKYEGEIIVNTLLVKDNNVPLSFVNNEEQIGSDEVGTGDFFGPICVCATHLSKKDIEKLKEMGIMDSKKMNDAYILKIGPALIKTFSYSQIALDNEKYNSLIANGENMNSIKAKLHNQAFLNLKRRFPKCENLFLDEFVNKNKYYDYLRNNDQIVKNIIFKTKGESYYPSVALGSVLARYSFLTKMDALSKKYEMSIPFGANEKVTEFARTFINRYGIDELNKIVKINFKNYQEL